MNNVYVANVYAAPKKNRNVAGIIVKILIIALLCCFSFAQVFPFYLQLVRSFQPESYDPLIHFGKLVLWPTTFSIKSYIEALTVSGNNANFGSGFINTLIVAGSYTALSMCVVLVVGYVLGKLNFRGKRVIFLVLIATMMVPGEIMLVPNYYLMVQFKMYNSHAALIFPGLVNIFGIFLVRQYMNTIPDSLSEAARIDGAGQFRIIFRIILPLTLPILGTYCILTFIALWNDFLWPMIMLRTDTKWTLQLVLQQWAPTHSANPEWNQTIRYAGLMLTIIPVLIVYIIFQRQFIDGISISGIK